MGKPRECSPAHREIKIEKGVPMPICGYHEWKALADKMEVGDSVWVASDAERINLRHCGARTHKKFISRRERDGFRMWRSN